MLNAKLPKLSGAESIVASYDPPTPEQKEIRDEIRAIEIRIGKLSVGKTNFISKRKPGPVLILLDWRKRYKP